MASRSAAMWERLHHALLGLRCACQASAQHFQQCAEFPLLRNRALGPLAVTVLPVAVARRAAATRTSTRCLIGRPAQSTLRLSSGSSRLYGSI